MKKHVVDFAVGELGLVARPGGQVIGANGAGPKVARAHACLAVGAFTAGPHSRLLDAGRPVSLCLFQNAPQQHKKKFVSRPLSSALRVAQVAPYQGHTEGGPGLSG